MTLQSIPYGVYMPLPPFQADNTPGLASTPFVLDGASEKAAIVAMAPATKNIRKVHFYTQTVTTGATLDVRIETVDPANGQPSGTLFNANANVAHVLDAADDNKWNTTAALTADAVLTRGDYFAIVIANPGASFGNFVIAAWNEDAGGNSFPYGLLFTASYAKQASAYPAIIVEYSDGSFEPIHGLSGFGIMVTSTFNSGSATNVIGNAIQLPFPARASGCWVWADVDADAVVELIDATDGTTVLATTPTIDTNMRQAGTPDLLFFPFTAPVTLAKDAVYYLVIRSLSGSNIILYGFEVPTALAMDSAPLGQRCIQAQRTSGGVWSTTDTQRSFMGVCLDAFDDGVGGGASGGGPLIGGRLIH